MEIYPAIDLMNGKAVRLVRGESSSAKIYGDPLDFAVKFSEYFKKLHIVDLDGSFSGIPGNLDTVRKIARETGSWIQLGGGIRTMENIKEAFDAGVSAVILGTSAADAVFLQKASEKFPGITVSLDSRRMKAATKGWVQDSDLSVISLFESSRKYVRRFIYTDVEKDGTLSGIHDLKIFWEGEEMIYAGGISGLQDLRKLEEYGFSGAIVGKAIYEDHIKLQELAGVG